MKEFIVWLASISFFFGIAGLFSVLLSLDYFKERLVFNDEDCIRITSFRSSEDQTKFNNNSILMTEWKHYFRELGEESQGAIYVASGFQHSATTKSTKEFVEKDLVIEELPISDFPVGVDFHPHGIYIHRPDSTLYVINHAYEKGGERIDVFEISTSEDGDDDPENDVPNKLFYKYSITSDWMKNEMNGALNSLMAVERNKFYVTQSKSHAEYRGGGWLDIETNGIMEQVKYLVFHPRNTFVWYCEYNEDHTTAASSPLQCRKVADGFVQANGITHNPDYSRVFVADSIDRTVTIFDRDPSTNDLNGRTTVKAPLNLDNIKFDETSGKIYGGGITNVFQSLKNYGNDKEKEFDTSTSGVYEFSHQLNQNGSLDWEFKLLLSTSKLNLASNGIRVKNHYVMGSFAGFKGILVCPAIDAEEDVDSSASKNSEL